MNIEHIFFDLDHTLWDFEKNSGLTFQKLFKDFKVDVAPDQFLKAYKPINKKYWKLYREEKVSKDDLRYYRLREAFDALEFSVADELIDTIAIKYIEYLPDFNHTITGAVELLDYLQEKYQLHIITNGFQEVQSLKMKKSGLLGYFDQIITSESVGVKKPNPRIFHHALQVSNALQENSMMIGDNLEADVEGAVNAGLQAIHCNFDNEFTEAKNIVSVASLLEIKQYL